MSAPPQAPVSGDRQHFKWWVIQAVFTVSGAAALAYEVVWGRWLATVLGGSTVATCVVLACYMGGLAMGAWFFGRLSSRIKSPLRAYVAVEVLIGLVAALFPIFASGVLGLPGSVRVAAAVVMLLVPTFLMGGTLPLVISWTEIAKLPEGTALSRLYGLNTVGAAFGCLAAGLWAIPELGLSLTNAAAAGVNLLLALVVFLISTGEVRQVSAEAEVGKDTAKVAAKGGALPLNVVAFLSGLATLGIEVIWIRLLRITLGSTTYTFSLVIATFILGLGVGGLWAGRVPEEAKVEPKLARGQLLLVLLLCAQFVALPATPWLFDLLRKLGQQWSGALLGSAIVCAVLLLPVTLVIGYLFPLLGRLYMRRGQRGDEVGHLYTVNTVGAVLGAVLTTLVLVPLLGTAAAFLGLLGLMFVSLAIYLRISGSHVRRWVYGGAGAVLVGFFVLVASQPGWGPSYLAYGAGWTKAKAGARVLYFKEGRSSTVLVEDYGIGKSVRIDGKSVASTVYEDLANQLLLGHLPAMLTTEVRRGLVVGLGTGMTLGALSLHDPEHLEIVEFEEAVTVAARHFSDLNHNVMDHPALEVHFDDGFNHLHATSGTYDVITSDPIQPFFRGAATLYSVDYFARAAEKLNERGVMAHWLPLGNMTTFDFKMIVRSFTDVFPYARLYWTGAFSDAVLVGRNTPWEGPGFVPAQYEKAAESLRSIYVESLEEASSLLIAGRPTLRAWAGEEGIRNTVERPILEFTAPEALYAYTKYEALDQMLQMRRHITFDHPAWHALTTVLAHKAQLRKTKDNALIVAYLMASSGCLKPEDKCPMVANSGVFRRLLWSHAMSEADEAFQRAFALEEIKRTWWYLGDASARAAVSEADLAYGVGMFEIAYRFTSPTIQAERDTLNERLDRLHKLVPKGSPLAARVSAMKFR